MVKSATARSGRRLERYTLGPLILLFVLIAVLFAIAGTPSRHYEALFAGALVGLLLGSLHGFALARGARSLAVMALVGLAVGLTTAKVLLGEANLSVAFAGSALILGIAVALRILRGVLVR